MNKKNIITAVLALEVCAFMFFYYRGAQGLRAVQGLEAENSELAIKINHAQQEIAQLIKELQAWQTDSFYKEKLAREQLHMARDNEEIYLT